jgi:hypothetical protein
MIPIAISIEPRTLLDNPQSAGGPCQGAGDMNDLHHIVDGLRHI